MLPMVFEAAISSGHKALARGAWQDALTEFDRATDARVTPEALEGLGAARWWLFDLPGAISARERAFNLYKDQGNTAAAARMALWIASDHHDRGEDAIANGWLGRAQRLLAETPASPEHAFCRIIQGHVALMGAGDLALAEGLAREAVALARETSALDYEMLAIALEGLSLVSRGEVTRGMALLDESTAAATGGEMTDLNAIAWACCYLIHACYRVRDYQRAAQWCDRVQTFCRRWSYDSMFTTCRTHYASILMWRGELDKAEQELTTLRLEAADRLPPLVRSAIVRLGELRRRQGRLDEAAELFDRAPEHKLSILGRAALALDRNDPEAARGLLATYLRRLPEENRTERLPVLELLVQCELGVGDLDGAARTVAELRAIANTLGSEPVKASAEAAEGLLLAATGDDDGARRALEDAVYLFEKNDARYEADRAKKALQRLAHKTDARGVERVSRLTRRELEILKLIAEGLTDREVADRLSISDHTVHRHVANILNKTGQSSRTAAVAFAVRGGFL